MSSRTVPPARSVEELTNGSTPPEPGKRGLRRDSFDGDYVRRLQENDPETERHFTAYFGELLLIKLRARLHHPQQIEDLRQETFLRVLTAIKSKNCLDSPESLGSFVNSVCNNLLCELYRRESRQRNFETWDQVNPPDRRASVESEMVSEAGRQEVRQVLEELSPKDRELLRMVYYEEIDRAEICRTFRVERQYLRVLMHRAKTRFRECLMRRYAEGGGANA